jgi:hypothetical protein
MSVARRVARREREVSRRPGVLKGRFQDVPEGRLRGPERGGRYWRIRLGRTGRQGGRGRRGAGMPGGDADGLLRGRARASGGLCRLDVQAGFGEVSLRLGWRSATISDGEGLCYIKVAGRNRALSRSSSCKRTSRRLARTAERRMSAYRVCTPGRFLSHRGQLMWNSEKRCASPSGRGRRRWGSVLSGRGRPGRRQSRYPVRSHGQKRRPSRCSRYCRRAYRCNPRSRCRRLVSRYGRFRRRQLAGQQHFLDRYLAVEHPVIARHTRPMPP